MLKPHAGHTVFLFFVVVAITAVSYVCINMYMPCIGGSSFAPPRNEEETVRTDRAKVRLVACGAGTEEDCCVIARARRFVFASPFTDLRSALRLNPSASAATKSRPHSIATQAAEHSIAKHSIAQHTVVQLYCTAVLHSCIA